MMLLRSRAIVIIANFTVDSLVDMHKKVLQTPQLGEGLDESTAYRRRLSLLFGMV
jgi:hypothetical protein